MSTRKAKISFKIKKLKNFMSIFTRSKRGMLGLAILMFFIIIAVAAPLITPYDPVYVPSHPRNPPIAYRWAKPVWYKYLPLAEDLSENVEPMQDPHFNTATSLEELELATSLTGHSLSLQFISDIGREEEEKEKKGCVAIVFSREGDEDPLGEVTANLTNVFYYPYKAPAKRFVGQVAMSVDASEDVSITINVVIEKEGGERRLEWWSKTFTSNGTTWITPSPPIDSSGEIRWFEQKFGPEWKMNPAQTMFSEQGNYRYGLEMIFNDTRRSEGEKVEATIYVDDFYIRLLGNSFGLLGSDQVGRDLFTQLVYGVRISLIIGLLSALFSTSIGLIIGLTAGYIGKFVDQILMRFTDLLLVIPDVPLYIVLMAVLRARGGTSMWNLVLLITVLGWTGFARVVRSQTLSLRERPFIEAAKAVGASRFRIIIRHIMPNVMNLVYVTLALSVPYAILSESWLSWLGLYDPKRMTWGRMLHHAEETAQGYKMWWWTLPPGLCIAAISVSFVLLGHALDEILNPQLRKRY